MPAARPTLFVLFAGLALGPTPACLHISGTVKQTDPVEVKPPITGDFASFPKRPGDMVHKNPDAISTAAKPAPTASEPMVALPPITDANVVKAKATDPATLPLVAVPAAAEHDLLAAMRDYLNDKPTDAIKKLQSLDRSSQDVALALMPIIVRGSQIKLASANPDELAVMVDQLHSLIGRLESKAALKVEKVAFCRKVTGFGRFEPWPEAQPYKPNDLAVLYVEVRNVGSEPAPGPAGESYLSRANVSLEVRDAKENLVEQTDPADWRRRVTIARFEHVDHTRSPLHDYSRTYRISVPTQPGVYTVTVEIKDPAGNRIARSQPAEFRVAGP